MKLSDDELRRRRAANAGTLKILGGLLAVLVLLVLVGSTLASDGSDTTALAPGATTSPATSPSASPSPSASSEGDLTELEAYMRRNFDGTSWYAAITGYEPFVDGVQINTRLFGAAEDRQFGLTICGAAIGSVGQGVPIRVAAGSGERLALKQPGGVCKP